MEIWSWYAGLWAEMFAAQFTPSAPAEAEEKHVPMKVIWEIGPQGYERGRCVPV